MVYTYLFCVLFGWALGFIPWLLAPWEKGKRQGQQEAAPVTPIPPEERWRKQLDNLLRYNGSEQGQRELEE